MNINPLFKFLLDNHKDCKVNLLNLLINIQILQIVAGILLAFLSEEEHGRSNDIRKRIETKVCPNVRKIKNKIPQRKNFS